MYRYFQTQNLVGELDKEIEIASHLVQLIIDDFIFEKVGENLIKKLKEGISVEVVIVSKSNKKSIRLVNYAKEIIDLNGLVYFLIDKKTYNEDEYFAIFDKSYLISQSLSKNYQTEEEIFRMKNAIFNFYSQSKNHIKLYSGNIEVLFETDKTHVKKNEKFKISWNVKNAHSVHINKGIGNVDSIGSIISSVEEDTSYKLTAVNKNKTKLQELIVKVSDIEDFKIDLYVFDEDLNNYVKLSPKKEIVEKYAVYNGQKVKISWDTPKVGKIFESNLGELKRKDKYEFIVNNRSDFVFTYFNLRNRKIKKISIYPFAEDEKKKSTNKTIQYVKKLFNLLKLK